MMFVCVVLDQCVDGSTTLPLDKVSEKWAWPSNFK